MQLFRIFVPGLGNIWVRGSNEQDAINKALAFASSQGINTRQYDTGDATLSAIPSAGPSGGATGFFIEDDGQARVIGTAESTDTGPGFPGTPGDPVPGDGAGDAGGSPVTPGGPLVDRLTREQFGQSAFNEFIRGRGVQPGNVGGFLAQTQFRPAFNTFEALNALGLVDPGQGFQDFLQGGRLGSRFGTAAQAGVDRLRSEGLAPDFQELGNRGAFTEDSQAVLNLARQAAGAGRSPIGLDLFQPTDTQLLQRRQDAAFRGENPDFLKFALSSFNRFAPRRSAAVQQAGFGRTL